MEATTTGCAGGCADPTEPIGFYEIRTKDAPDRWIQADYCRECYLLTEESVRANAADVSFNGMSDAIAIRLASIDYEGYTG